MLIVTNMATMRNFDIISDNLTLSESVTLCTEMNHYTG